MGPGGYPRTWSGPRERLPRRARPLPCGCAKKWLARVADVVHVLLIEDDPGIRIALARALSNRGHAVDSAPDGLDGLQALLTGQPDVVVLDLGLPDVSGERLLGMIRAVDDVPVIVATARDDEGLIVSLLDAGADDYIVKPFDPQHILKRASGPSCVGLAQSRNRHLPRSGWEAFRSTPAVGSPRLTASRWT